MGPIGFSTGAIAKSDFRRAVAALVAANIRAVELSALRLGELRPLIEALDEIDLSHFDYISVHAPSSFSETEEPATANVLRQVVDRGWPVILHPNVIYEPESWAAFGGNLLIENMDRRKPLGRTAAELESLMTALPQAGLCLDLGHARQVDPTMTEAALLIERFRDRIRQLHVSEVNERSHHDPISASSIDAFRWVADLLPPDVPVILEPLIDQGQSDISAEVEKAMLALQPVASRLASIG
jgi:hypothetical protein